MKKLNEYPLRLYGAVQRIVLIGIILLFSIWFDIKTVIYVLLVLQVWEAVNAFFKLSKWPNKK